MKSYRADAGRVDAALLALVALLPLVSGPGCGKQAGRTPVFPATVRSCGRASAGERARHSASRNAAGLERVRPVAHANEGGFFDLTTYEEGDGAPAGQYAVTVEWRRPARAEDNAPPANQLPARYSRPDSTPLHVRIDAGTNELPPLELKR